MRHVKQVAPSDDTVHHLNLRPSALWIIIMSSSSLFNYLAQHYCLVHSHCVTSSCKRPLFFSERYFPVLEGTKNGDKTTANVVLTIIRKKQSELQIKDSFACISILYYHTFF